MDTYCGGGDYWKKENGDLTSESERRTVVK